MLMRVAVVGAGALGSLIGHALCRAGCRVTLIDRPRRLAAIEALGGLVVVDPEGQRSLTKPAVLSSAIAGAGPHEVVFLATKAHDLPPIASELPSLLGPDGFFVTVQNGIPWWYLRGIDHALPVSRLSSVDPHGQLEKHLDTTRIVGCVAYPAAMLRADGTVEHVQGRSFPVGELDGRERERTRRLVALFVDAGFKSRVLPDIRAEIWLKALGALSINPISALARATMVDICTFGPTRALVAEMMGEAQCIAEALGVSLRHTIDERIEGARAVGQHKTSMLQDVENGRPMELDALMSAVLELAELTGCKADAMRHVHACAALLNRGIVPGAR